MTAPRIARPPYAKRDVPTVYTAGWWVTELGNLQRAIPSTNIKTIAGNYMPTVADATLLGDATAGAFTVTLPAPARVKGLVLTVKKIDASAHAVTLDGTIDGVVNPTLATRYKAITVQSDGTAWYTLATV